MRKKAYISRFFILYLNPLSLGLYGFGCYHMMKYLIGGEAKNHLPIVFGMLAFMLVWFFCCMVLTIRMMIQDKKREEISFLEKKMCHKQTLFHVASVFFVIVFLGMTGITLGTYCCSIKFFLLR